MTIQKHPLPPLTEKPFYTELRMQENIKQTLQLINGDVTSNSVETVSGTSARVCNKGQWGFASLPEIHSTAIEKVLLEAHDNAAFLAKKHLEKKHTKNKNPETCFAVPDTELSRSTFNIDKNLSSAQPAKTLEEKLHYLKVVDDYIQQHYPDLESRILRLHLENIEKRIVTSTGSSGYTLIPRTVLYVWLIINNDQGEPVELMHIVSERGEFQDVLTETQTLFTNIDRVYQQLLEKKQAVPAQAGYKDVILDSELAGMLAHEAIGHPTEADLVMAGSVAADLLNQSVASPLISMVDFAHSYKNELLPVPVFIDDEGCESKDTILIDQGILKSFMHNRQSAATLNHSLTGNARAFKYFDEPLIRMRNTAILPGASQLADMIASIDDGYYLIKSSNGEADATAEFMFGVTLGYEIKNGKLGRAIKETTISGMAFDVLKTVTMVSNELHWECSGYCGKKQIIPVAVGGPAIKCKVHIGGE